MMDVEQYYLSAYYPYISEVEIWELNKVLAWVEPGDTDWSWRSQFKWLDENRKDRLEELRRSIDAMGLDRPLVIGPDMRLWDGHHRLRVLYDLRYRYVPVELLPDTNPWSTS